MNPADLLTRGLNTNMFNDKKKIWFQGPPWLREPKEEWPPNPTISIITKLEHPQMKITIMKNVGESPNIQNIIDITRYSTLARVLRVTALLVQVARKWGKTKVYHITTKQMLEARTLLLKATQQTTYRQEISYLKNKDKFKEPVIIQQLNLYLDNGGLIRCRGRLEYTDLPHDTKFPILIPKDNYLTTLIVQYMHKVVMHGGVRETLTQIRQTRPTARQKNHLQVRNLQKNPRTAISF